MSSTFKSSYALIPELFKGAISYLLSLCEKLLSVLIVIAIYLAILLVIIVLLYYALGAVML